MCTHHGSFHCDEALGVGMLKLLPQYASMPLVRTRKTEDIDGAAIVLDVGGTYDPEAKRFDHHQPEFQDSYDDEHDIRLSSAGLIFKHFGAEVVQAAAAQGGAGPTLSEADLSVLVGKMYEGLIQEVDAIDNGVDMVCQGPGGGASAKYTISTDLASRVKRLNLKWHQPHSEEAEMAAFKEAVKVTVNEFVQIVAGYAQDWLPARTLVAAALAQAPSVHASGQVMVLEQYCPWQGHIFDLEAEGAAPAGQLKYVVYPDTRGKWRLQAVPAERGSFKNRKPLPAAWRGARDEELSSVTGIPGCIFVHAAGFIGGNETKAGALAMAVSAAEAAAE